MLKEDRRHFPTAKRNMVQNYVRYAFNNLVPGIVSKDELMLPGTTVEHSLLQG